jgi:hypothetical protein
MFHEPHIISPHPIWKSSAESANHEKMLEQIEDQISKTKEEAFSRKEILEKVEKWLAAIQEESWLEEYNRVRHISFYYCHYSYFFHALYYL